LIGKNVRGEVIRSADLPPLQLHFSSQYWKLELKIMSVPKGVESASLPAEDDADSRSKFLHLTSLQIFHLQQNVLMASKLLSTQITQPSKPTATR
jgi:hypothetical protein